MLNGYKGALLYAVRCSALDAALGSPFGRAKAACNRIYGHKKRSVSASIRSINCFTNPALIRRLWLSRIIDRSRWDRASRTCR